MNLQELCDRTMEGEKDSRIAGTKTAVKALAHALGYLHASECPQEAYTKPLETLYHKVEKLQAGKGPHVIRNTKNFLSYMMRKAQERAVLALPPPTLQPRFSHKALLESPNRQGYVRIAPYYLKFADWPDRLRKDWDDFYRWATADYVKGRASSLKKKPISLHMVYQPVMQAFYGYLVKEKGFSPSDFSFDQLRDFSLIHAFVDWHINTLHGKVTAIIYGALRTFKALTAQYFKDEALLEQLRTLAREIPRPVKTYNKEEVWVPLAELRKVGEAIWPTKKLEDIPGNGAGFARDAGLSLMVQLWCNIPYRQRNMREMELGKNLYKNTDGEWTLHFAGEQLKIAQKQGKENIFELAFPPRLVPLLEQYLEIWRPVLVRKGRDPSQHVFLNVLGKPYNVYAMRVAVLRLVYRYTEKKLHPHLIRTIWATEYIKKTGDIYRAAVMLNDKLETVVANYSHLSLKGVAEHTYAVMDDICDPDHTSPTHAARVMDRLVEEKLHHAELDKEQTITISDDEEEGEDAA